MDDLYFLGDELGKVLDQVARAEASWHVAPEPLRARLKSLQEECPHQDQWEKDGKCSFCRKDWAEVVVEKERARQEFGRHAREVLSAHRVAWQSIEALKENCPHPRAAIVNESKRTYCNDCTETLWPRRLYGSGFVRLNPTDLADIKGAITRFEAEEKRLQDEIIRIQARCPHPEEEKVSADGMEYDCGVCGLDWGKVLDRRKAMSRLARV